MGLYNPQIVRFLSVLVTVVIAATLVTLALAYIGGSAPYWVLLTTCWFVFSGSAVGGFHLLVKPAWGLEEGPAYTITLLVILALSSSSSPMLVYIAQQSLD